MHSNLRSMYVLVKDLLSEKDFENRIKKMREEMGGLLDDESIAMIVVDELGRNKSHISSISSLKPDGEYTVFGRIVGINEPVRFSRNNGSNGKVVNLKIADNTGECTLVLWDDDVDLVDSSLTIGTIVKIVNGYTKNGADGLEINVGRWSSVEINPEDAPFIKKEHDSSIEGTVLKKEPTKSYFKDDGEFGFMREIIIESKGERKNIILWNEHAKTMQSIEEGDRIKITNIYRKIKNGKEEFHVNSHSTITKS